MAYMKRDYNYGVALLRILLCVLVVVFHTLHWNEYDSWIFKLLYKWSFVPVPVFMMTSFYFLNLPNTLHSNRLIQDRLHRLLLPNMIWAIVYFLVYFCLDSFLGGSYLHGPFDLLWQFLFGHVYNKTLWFQIDLVVLTFIFFVFFYFSNQIGMVISSVLSIFCLVLQFMDLHHCVITSINWPSLVFNHYFNPSYVINPLGRLFEMFPYCAIGTFLSSQSIVLKNLKKYKFLFLILILLFTISTLFFRSNIDCPLGFSYSGIFLIIMSLNTFLFFFAIPNTVFLNNTKPYIRFLSERTMGVYFIHRLVDSLLNVSHFCMKTSIKEGSLVYSLCVVIFSFVTVSLIKLMPIKMIRESV